MSEYGLLFLYCLAVLVVSLIGGYFPFLGKVTHAKLQMYLSLSAGVMLGASFFHVMPDAMQKAGSLFGWWMALGVVGLFCIERFIAPHSHEVDTGGHHHHSDPSKCEHEHDHDHDHDHDDHNHGHDHGHDHGGLRHYHDEDMQSFSVRSERPLDPDKFFSWIQNLVAQEGQKILRCKGILSFRDDPERFVFQGVHMILDGDHQRAWKDGEERVSRAVFIGRDMPEEMIRKGFAECVA